MINNDDTKQSTNKPRRSSKKPKISKRKKMKYAKQISLGVAIAVLIALAGLIINFVYGVIKDTEAFSASNLLSYGGVKILDKDENVIFQRGSDPTDYNDLPQVLVDALVATEDSRYFEHNGFDIPRIFMAAIKNVAGGQISSGASTITQQLIKKKYYPDEAKTFQRKIGEIYLAIQADAELEKTDILANYLNTIAFGRGPSTVGIRSAARYYFDKDPSQLTLPEAAYLAGSLNAPHAYDAYYNIEKATARRNTVLNLMLQHGYITEAECNLAKSTKLENLLKHPEKDGSANSYQAYIDAVVEDAVEIMYKDQYSDEEIQANKSDLTNELLEKPITIHTYMDTSLQEYLDDIQAGKVVNMPFDKDRVDIACSIQENHTGRIVGLIGGRNYAEENTMFGLNLATSSKQQPGSSLKPIVAYGPAFEYLHWSTAASIKDEAFEDTPGFKPIKNWDGKYHGNILIRDALAQSYNAPAVLALKQAVEKQGRQEVIDWINALGLTVNDANGQQYADFNLRYAIGAWGEGVTMVQEAGAYATIVNKGKYIEPHVINYIEYETDHTQIMVDEKIQADATQAITEQTAFMIQQIMLDYTKTGGFFYKIRSTGVECGAKTGTSTTTAGEDKASLMAAFTPDYSISCWVGNATSSNTRLPSAANGIPGTAVQKIIMKLHPNAKVTNSYPTAPDGIVKSTMIKGTNPYISAQSDISSSYTVSGYFYADNTPSNKGLDITIDQLTHFTAQSINDKALKVAFGAYNKDFTQGAGDGDDDDQDINLNLIYGHIMYTTIIRDAAGNEITRSSQTTNEYTIDYNITSPIKVCGVYNFSEATSKTSNEVCVQIDPKKVDLPEIKAALSDGNGQALSNNSTTYSNQVTINVTAFSNESNITVTLNGGSAQSSVGNGSFKYSNLQPGKYTIEITEENPKASNEKVKKLSFTVANQTEDSQ